MKILPALLIILLPLCSVADSVVPIDKVAKSVNIRMSPDARSDIVGKLNQGDSIRLAGTTEGWHEVILEGDATGFISADWSRVIPDADIAVVEEDIEDVDIELIVESVKKVVEEVAEEVAEESVEEAAEDAAAVEDVIESVVEDEPVPEAIPEPEPAEVQATLKGSRNFLIKFRDETAGGNSQVFDDGNQVGIGTTAPKQRLEVNGSIQIHEQNSSVAGLMITQSTGDTGYIMHNRANTLTIGAGSEDRITIDRDGNVGIAVAKPRHPLEMASGAHVTAGGVWTNSSSHTRKENIQTLSFADASEALQELQPVRYNYTVDASENYVGFIAEDVPDLVAMKDRESLSTMDIVAVLTKVVQEQQTRIEALEARLIAD